MLQQQSALAFLVADTAKLFLFDSCNLIDKQTCVGGLVFLQLQADPLTLANWQRQAILAHVHASKLAGGTLPGNPCKTLGLPPFQKHGRQLRWGRSVQSCGNPAAAGCDETHCYVGTKLRMVGDSFCFSDKARLHRRLPTLPSSFCSILAT